jgi:hypothetical protein
MSNKQRTIDMVPKFLDGLADIQRYHSQYNAAKGRKLSSAILDFAYNTVSSFPAAYPLYQVSQYPDREYRRAVFKREFVLIYRVTDTAVTFLVIYGSRQNQAAVVLPD